MKCPKCGYLGFETTDRCRNCQYDFSLAPFATEPELPLHGADRKTESPADFELPPIKRQTDSLSATALDLDRLFGTPEPKAGITMPAPPAPTPRNAEPPSISLVEAEEPPPSPAIEEPIDDPIAEQISSYVPPAIETDPIIAVAPDSEPAPEVVAQPVEEPVIVPEPAPALDLPPVAPDPPAPMSAAEPDESALPFDDAPLVPPPAARPPLAVRRSTPEVPRNRPRTTRPVKIESLNLEAPAASSPNGGAARAATETVASLLEAPSLGVRLGAGLIDVLLLAGISAVVLYLTLRVTGLQNTLEDLRVLPPVPFVGFLSLLIFGYVAAFTVAGGQTIGKMMLGLRVIGDDGRPVDAAGGMLRALGCMLVPITLGLSYLPALFTSDHRALHDRLAGTRVVQE